MNQNDIKLYEARANIVKALAHPSRLFIVDMLNNQSRTVGELTEMIGADTSTVSKHLSVLKNAGIIEDEKKGTTVFYMAPSEINQKPRGVIGEFVMFDCYPCISFWRCDGVTGAPKQKILIWLKKGDQFAVVNE